MSNQHQKLHSAKDLWQKFIDQKDRVKGVDEDEGADEDVDGDDDPNDNHSVSDDDSFEAPLGMNL